MLHEPKTRGAAYNLGCTIGCATFLIGVIFVALKLTGVIDWHWAWVLLPFGPPALATIGVSLVFIVKGTVGLLQSSPEELDYVQDEFKGLSRQKSYALAQLGMGTSYFLGFLFIVLKLTGAIDWSWWVLLALYLGPISLMAIAALLVGMVALRRYQPSKKQELRPSFAVGGYSLNMKLTPSPSLREFSREEYEALAPIEFVGQKIYHGPPVEFLGRPWDLALGAVKGKLFKIALTVMFEKKDEANQVAKKTLRFLNDKLGSPERQGTRMFVWDTTDGNVILQTVEAIQVFGVNVFLTSQAVREFQHVK